MILKKFDAEKFFQALKRDLWVILLDVVAVNASYYLALLIRFYVNSEFRPTVSYLLGDWASFVLTWLFRNIEGEFLLIIRKL